MEGCSMLNKYLYNDNGSTLLMTVVVMMLLVVLSTVLITLSAAHFKISHAYNENSNEYYELDQQSEAILKHIDTELEFAEKFAQDYIASELYTINDLGDSKLNQSIGNQSFNMSSLQKESYDYQLPKQDDSTYLQLFNLDFNYQTYFHEKYIRDVLEQADLLKDEFTSSDSDSVKAYHDLLEDYTKEIYNSIYFMVSKERLDKLIDDDTMPLKDNYTMTFDSNRGIGIDNRSIYEPELIIKGKSNGVNESLKLELQIIIPQYKVAPEISYKQFKTNPVWTNAITASGSIDFESGETQINGDLYTLGDGISEGIIVKSGSNTQVKGNVYTADNIVVMGHGSQLNVGQYEGVNLTYKKNLYATEDSDIDSAYYLEGVSNKSVENKFGPGDFIDQPYSIGQRKSDDTKFWYFSRDEIGGNVYCNNLKVHSTAQGASLEVENAWVYNDVVMNGIKNSLDASSHLTIRNILIGLNSEGAVGSSGINPTMSSTVVNNSFNKGGKITLNKYLISGLTYMPFDKFNGNTGEYYYRTVEGITSNNTEIFTAVYDIGDPDTKNPDETLKYDRYTLVLDSQGEFDYYLEDFFSHVDNESKIKNLFSEIIEGIDDNGDSKLDVKTNIFINSTRPRDVVGYSTGAVLAHYNNNESYVLYKQGGDPDLKTTYATLNTKVDESDKKVTDFYNQKVTQFGLQNTNKTSIHGYVNETIMNNIVVNNGDLKYYIYKTENENDAIKLPEDVNANNRFIYIKPDAATNTTTVRISGEANGIIYCMQGNLIIEGSGTFNGTIICNGDVTIRPLGTGENSLTLNYDEKVIAKLINNSSEIESFFSYTYGLPNIYKYKTATTGYFTEKKRYKINSWKWGE